MPQQTANSTLVKELPGTVIPLGIAVLDYSFKGTNQIYVKFVHEEGDTSQSAEFKCSANPRDVTFSFATWMNGYHHAHLRKDTKGREGWQIKCNQSNVRRCVNCHGLGFTWVTKAAVPQPAVPNADQEDQERRAA